MLYVFIFQCMSLSFILGRPVAVPVPVLHVYLLHSGTGTCPLCRPVAVPVPVLRVCLLHSGTVPIHVLYVDLLLCLSLSFIYTCCSACPFPWCNPVAVSVPVLYIVLLQCLSLFSISLVLISTLGMCLNTMPEFKFKVNWCVCLTVRILLYFLRGISCNSTHFCFTPLSFS